MTTNELKRKLRAGEPVLGAFVPIPSPEVVEMMGAAGLDFAIVDSEHGPLDSLSVLQLVRAADAAGVTAVVRMGGVTPDPDLILKALDAGAKGIQMPQVNDSDRAEALVRWTQYPPAGMRGLAFSTRAAGYGARAGMEYTATANDEVLVIAQVESVEAVANLDAILAVPGIDVIFIGPTDLAQSMGRTGRVDDPDVQATIRAVVTRARAAGRAVGIFVRDGADAGRWAREGVQFLATSVIGLFTGACRRILQEYHAAREG